MTRELLFEIEVPPDERCLIDDTPEAYRVMREGPCVCIVYGRYHGRWQANASARWLVAHLLKALKKHGDHAKNCERPWGPKCDCGWEELRKSVCKG